MKIIFSPLHNSYTVEFLTFSLYLLFSSSNQAFWTLNIREVAAQMEVEITNTAAFVKAIKAG